MARLGRNAGAHFVCTCLHFQCGVSRRNRVCNPLDCDAERLSRVDNIKLERTVILNGAQRSERIHIS